MRVELDRVAGVVSMDWSNGRAVWAQQKPMDCDGMLLEQAKLVKAIDPTTHFCKSAPSTAYGLKGCLGCSESLLARLPHAGVYRNIVKGDASHTALPTTPTGIFCTRVHSSC